jgi:5-methylcytosine-specific restriction endonuclease McrA
MDTKCPLCKRPLGQINVDAHHLVPKTFKGKELVELHKICHRKIHATFTERELLHYYHTIDRLLENDHIQSFVKWVAKKDPSFYDGSKETAERKKKRR